MLVCAHDMLGSQNTKCACTSTIPAEPRILGIQEVLAGVQTGEVGSPMTMADATRFADNALEHMVRTLLAALTAPAILESMQGALRWDGLQYEKRYRRLLSPPLQRLLTQPGVLHSPLRTPMQRHVSGAGAFLDSSAYTASSLHCL